MALQEENVRVAVRIRPLVKSETSRGCKKILEKVPNQPKIQVKKSETFGYDHVFTQNTSQESIYEAAVGDLVDRLFQGYNITVLSYGQTGSGKTYTMGTAFDGELDADAGIIPRAVHEIFGKVENMTEYTFEVTCSFMELYQEQLFDLLSSNSREDSVVDILEDENKEKITQGLTESVVASAAETADCLMKGSARRAVAATAMNPHSSRSHTIFTISVLKIKKSDPSATTLSKFHFVDLAGSQRSKKTKDTGDRFKEGIKIKQGHLALKNVISALGSSQSHRYVGYRDSKLTRVLQDALGGNSVTLMIACVSPADYNEDETLSTLRYADQAKKIRNKPIVNKNPKAVEINRLNKIIHRLRQELAKKNAVNEALPEQQNETENIEQVVSTVHNEIDTILSVVDAKFTLERLMDERISLALESENIKNGDSKDNKAFSVLEKEIKNNNARISELQKKVLASDTDSNIKEIYKVIHNGAEGRAAVKHLIGRIVDMQKEMSVMSKGTDDHKDSPEILKAKISELENQIDALQIQHLEDKARILGQCDAMRDEAEAYKKEMEKLTKDLEDKLYIKSRSKKNKKDEEEDVDNEDNHEGVKTSRIRGRGNVQREAKNLKPVDEVTQESKKPSDASFRCSCKGDCTKKICTCRKNSSVCSENCRCTEICANRGQKQDKKKKSNSLLKIKLLPE